MQIKIIQNHRKAGALLMGAFMIGLLISSVWNVVESQRIHRNHEEAVQDFQKGNNEFYAENIPDFHYGNPDGKEIVNIDLSVNPFVETAANTGAKANTAGKKGGNYRNLPAIPAVYPASQPRPVLPLPSIPRMASQNPQAAVSAPAKAVEAAPKENKEAQIAFLGGGDIMFAHGMDNGN